MTDDLFPRDNQSGAAFLYTRCALKARDPEYYTHFAVHDTIFGRFEILVLHLFLILRRLKEDASLIAQDMSQELCDLFVTNMDQTLRTARLSEAKVDKTFKQFIEGFYGRLVAYDTGLEEAELDHAILKNVYGGDPAYRPTSQELAVKLTNLLTHLRRQPDVLRLTLTGDL
jgi:cytochrome b pre-mRNA-processing protein 3